MVACGVDTQEDEELWWNPNTSLLQVNETAPPPFQVLEIIVTCPIKKCFQELVEGGSKWSFESVQWLFFYLILVVQYFCSSQHLLGTRNSMP